MSEFDSLKGLTEHETREIANAAIGMDGSDFDTETFGGDVKREQVSTRLSSIRRTWSDHWWSPLRFTEAYVRYWDNGDWEYEAKVTNESGHSDWDVWLRTFHIKSQNTGQNVHDLCTGRCAYTDVDHGHWKHMRASGQSEFVRNHFDDLRDGTYVTVRGHRRTRDN